MSMGSRAGEGHPISPDMPHPVTEVQTESHHFWSHLSTRRTLLEIRPNSDLRLALPHFSGPRGFRHIPITSTSLLKLHQCH